MSKKNNIPTIPEKEINILKRKPQKNEMEEELLIDKDLYSKKKKILMDEKTLEIKNNLELINEKINYEESFKVHLFKQSELQKNIEFFNKNIEQKIIYDRNFSSSILKK